MSCVICDAIGAEGQPPDAVAELATAWVTAGFPEPPASGYACVVHKRHVVEPFELDESEGAAYWSDVMRTARALAEITRPRKLNYEIHGNTIPHLHTHLFSREPSGETERDRLVQMLRSALS
jgi:diadenosine tetraphosphate (Ap4A) HIT family hydrolase